ncbi:ribosomal biogenesis regulatory protein [Microthyrium microscopicum]|uniref:Ribosome biogenesis regulatory protein n=1 Tax=Microthyrium microscopicum TaxID=703497 RepID=A0A6A6UKX2_9PEZI|nr:ribosomal biogenesis regulatory protein [Microthyrium microscopicum]
MSDTEMADAVQPISPSEQLRKESAEQPTTNGTSRPPVTVTKPIPYTFDLGHLLLHDANPIPADPTTETLLAEGRDCAQALINQLLTTCPVTSTPEGVYLGLPDPQMPLPREKAIPKEKEPTRWEKFATKRGIKAKKRDGNKVYDEATGEWVAKWGYKGKNKAGENDWLVEVDADKEKRTGEAGDVRKEKRAERVERLKRQERRERTNDKRAFKTAG